MGGDLVTARINKASLKSMFQCVRNIYGMLRRKCNNSIHWFGAAGYVDQVGVLDITQHKFIEDRLSRAYT
eukprot:3710847-Prorocentrum_lima.AAC.1